MLIGEIFSLPVEPTAESNKLTFNFATSEFSGSESGFPITLDASNNGYQHLAALLGRRNLAEAVNLIPPRNSKGKPLKIWDERDLYSEVAKTAKDLFILDLTSCIDGFDNFSDEKQSEIKRDMFTRDFAKPITMTMAYGAADLDGQFEGHPRTGKPKFLIKRYVYFDESNTCREKDCKENFENEKDFKEHLELSLIHI